jgi:hypothetical protein
MYTTSVIRSQVYVPLLPDRYSSLYDSHFLVRRVYNPSGLLRSLLARLSFRYHTYSM